MAVELSDEEMLRYNRQIILRGFDFDGQEQLKASRVLVVGLGGLGCAAAQYLAAAGIGQLTLLDFDTVSLSNLQRQTLHSDPRPTEGRLRARRAGTHQPARSAHDAECGAGRGSLAGADRRPRSGARLYR